MVIKHVPLLKGEKAKLRHARKMAIGNVKVTRAGYYGVKISGGAKGSKPIVVNIQGPIKSIVKARNTLYKKKL